MSDALSFNDAFAYQLVDFDPAVKFPFHLQLSFLFFIAVLLVIGVSVGICCAVCIFPVKTSYFESLISTS